MKNHFSYPIFLFIGLMAGWLTVRAQDQLVVYLIPGQGSDERVFSQLVIDSRYTVKHVSWQLPGKNCSLPEFAAEIGKQIDTTHAFVLIGVSLGGMIATELNQSLAPKQTIVISSAKCRSELPLRYRFLRFLPINRLIPAFLYKWGAQIAQPLVEPDRKHQKATFVAMLKSKDGRFLKRTSNMIIKWERSTYPSEIIHIHGTADHTVPYRNVDADFTVENGSHMMILTKANEISQLINDILHQSN